MTFVEGDVAFGGGGGRLDRRELDRNVLGDAAENAFQVAIDAALLENEVPLHVERGEFAGARLEAAEIRSGEEFGPVGGAGRHPRLNLAAQSARAGHDIHEQRLAGDRHGRVGGRGRLGRGHGHVRV